MDAAEASASAAQNNELVLVWSALSLVDAWGIGAVTAVWGAVADYPAEETASRSRFRSIVAIIAVDEGASVGAVSMVLREHVGGPTKSRCSNQAGS